MLVPSVLISLTTHLLSVYEKIKLLGHFSQGQYNLTTNALTVAFKNIYYAN